MTINNLHRDMFWAPEPTAITEQGANSLTQDHKIATDGVAYVKHGQFQCADASVSGSTLKSFGVAMQMFNLDTVPYRFKASATEPMIWAVGFSDTLANEITVDKDEVRFIHCGNQIDECVALKPKSASPNAYAIFYGIMNAGVTNFVVTGSVQRMLNKPDTFSTGVT